jgi:hypothetical protein
MTNTQLLSWIKQHLGPHIQKAIAITKCNYTEDWLAAMARREYGHKIMEFTNRGMKPEDIHQITRGDYGQRPGETEKQYHGFGYWQIDIHSYPDFIKTGNWKDPLKCCIKAIEVLNEKRDFIQRKTPGIAGTLLEDAVTAAYNTGQGNVVKSIQAGRSVDSTTFNKDYAKSVRKYRAEYKALK